jgi:hypothetical protein
MSSSSFLDNLMRSGSSSHNGRITFSGTTLTVADYGGLEFTAAAPLLLRFSPTEVTVIPSGTMTFDFGAGSWGKQNDDGTWSMCIGFQRLSDSTAQICIGLSSERGDVTTVVPSNATDFYSIAAPVSATGKIVWIARLNNIKRQGGAWITTNAWMEE